MKTGLDWWVSFCKNDLKQTENVDATCHVIAMISSEENYVTRRDPYQQKNTYDLPFVAEMIIKVHRHVIEVLHIFPRVIRMTLEAWKYYLAST